MNNREIKFRVWMAGEMFYSDSERDFRLEWRNEGNVTDGLYLHYSEYDEKGKKIGWTSTNGFALMQYTGLKDKSGKEIYEGDVVKLWDAKNDEVKYSPDLVRREKFGWNFEKNEIDRFELVELEDRLRVEVIGNEFENPELLED